MKMVTAALTINRWLKSGLSVSCHFLTHPLTPLRVHSLCIPLLVTQEMAVSVLVLSFGVHRDDSEMRLKRGSDYYHDVYARQA